MRSRNLPHRASFVFLHNSGGLLFVQQRVAWKETYPSHHDPAPVRTSSLVAC
jgi:isopentenyldiphosphate isomerase